MEHFSWDTMHTGLAWFLWLGFVLLILSSLGNWGYSYRTHRKFTEGNSRRDAIEILNERYASGQIDQAEFEEIKLRISEETK